MPSLPDVVQEIDEDIATPRGSIKYPYLFLNKVADVLGLIVPLLAPGDVPIVLEANGALREVGTVDKSALEMYKLLRVCPFDFVVSPQMRYSIKTAEQLLEVPLDVWMH